MQSCEIFRFKNCLILCSESRKTNTTNFRFPFWVLLRKKIQQFEGKQHFACSELNIFIHCAWSKLFENSKAAGVHFVESQKNQFFSSLCFNKSVCMNVYRIYLSNRKRGVCQLASFVFFNHFVSFLFSFSFSPYGTCLSGFWTIFLSIIPRVCYFLSFFSLTGAFIYLSIYTYGNETACAVRSPDGQWWNTEIRLVWIGWHEVSQYNNEC